MGVSTIMFITAKPESILEIMPKAIRALNKWQRNELANYADRKGFDGILQFIMRDKSKDIGELKEFTNGVKVNTHDFELFNIRFSIYGELRNLSATHVCSEDYSDIYQGGKIIFSLGSWGMSEEIMMVVAEAIKDFGDIYFVKEDITYNFTKLDFSKNKSNSKKQ